MSNHFVKYEKHPPVLNLLHILFTNKELDKSAKVKMDCQHLNNLTMTLHFTCPGWAGNHGHWLYCRVHNNCVLKKDASQKTTSKDHNILKNKLRLTISVLTTTQVVNLGTKYFCMGLLLCRQDNTLPIAFPQIISEARVTSSTYNGAIC